MGPLSFERLVNLLDASLEIELRELARASPAAVFRELPDVSWAVGAVSSPTVYRTRLGTANTANTADAAARIAELSGALETFGPVTWWAGPSAEPAELPDLLVDAGYHLEDDEAGMAVDLKWLADDLPRPAGLEIVEVQQPDGSLDEAALEGWLEVNRRTLAWPDEKVARRRALYRDDDRRPRSWRHFVARLDDAAVSASRILMTDDVAMVHVAAVSGRPRGPLRAEADESDTDDGAPSGQAAGDDDAGGEPEFLDSRRTHGEEGQ